MVASGDELEGKLEEALSGWTHLVILGIGNEFGGDDKLGLLAAHRLKEALSDVSRVDILEAGNAPENFTGLLRKLSPSHTLLIDAAEVREEVGAVKIIEPQEIQKQMPSTHSIPLYMLVNYLEHELGSKVIILGIQAKKLSFGAPISEEVGNSVDQLVLMLDRLLSNPPKVDV
jgi:hydrogenase 3 maturation protease